MIVALIRHGPTAWNAEKRLQGRSDIPLSDVGRAAVSAWRIPADIAGYAAHSSPLDRAVETARLLGLDPKCDPDLTEMSFGDWEGRRVADLRAELGAEMTENEARGLDFTPPGGESPRQVQTRIAPLFAGWAVSGHNRTCITHKGVIRAIYAHAVGWDMTGRLPDRLQWDAAHLFRLDRSGVPSVLRLNLSLTQEDGS